MNFLLLSTSACHLCEQARDLITANFSLGVIIEIVDIAEQTQWQEKYALRIPVLIHVETGDELSWKFDAPMLADFVQKIIDKQHV